MIILGDDRSVPKGNMDKGAVGDQEGFYLITHGDGLTCYIEVKFNVFLTCQTHLVQPKLLMGDATGVQFGACILMVIGTVNTICVYT